MASLRVKESTSGLTGEHGGEFFHQDVSNITPGEPLTATVTTSGGEWVRGSLKLVGNGIDRTVGRVGVRSFPVSSDLGEPSESGYINFSAPKPGQYRLKIENQEGPQTLTTSLTVADPAEVGDTGQDVNRDDAESAAERAVDSDETMAPDGSDVPDRESRLADQPGYVHDGDGGAEVAPALWGSNGNLNEKGALAAVALILLAAWYANE